MTIQKFGTRRILLPLWEVFSGSEYLSYYNEIKGQQWDSREEVKKRQLMRLQKLLIHAHQTVPYYQDLFNNANFDPKKTISPDSLKHIPPLTKERIRENSKRLLSNAVSSSQLIKNATGGSTGKPLQFYVTKLREMRHASTIALNYEWAGLPIGDRIAILWGSAFDQKRYQSFYGRITNALLGRLFMSALHLSDDVLENYVKRINRFKPKVLLGYTSILLAMADYLEKTGSKLTTLQSVISGAETLYPFQRERLEKIFSCKVFNRYGGRDSGAVAAECPEQGNMHINSNLCYVEVSNEGNIVITDLFNFGMPFIRYDTGDQGNISTKLCECGRGSPYFQSIKGRVHDLLIARDGRKIPGELFPHLFKDYAWIDMYQVVQKSREALHIKIVKSASPHHSEDIKKITQIIKDHFGEIEVKVNFVKNIPPTASGKYRFTICEI